MPLGDAVALGMTAPLFVVALSVVLLGEVVGWRRWTAVMVGFGGMLIIVRPGTPEFQPASILLLAAAVTGALGLVLTRRMSDEDWLTLLTWAAVVGLIGSTPLAIAVWRTPTLAEALLLTVNGATNLVAQFLAVRALFHAPASALAPIQYTHVVWAIAISVLVFGVWPDAWTFAGTAIIVTSGLYVWWRERVRGAPPSALATLATPVENARSRGGDT
jgi:drug/metabolite transporter (DMT)-like permease